IFEPSFIDGLRVSVDYTRIEKTDEINGLQIQQLLDNEASFPAQVTRGPNLPGDQPGWAGPVTALDCRSQNLASTVVVAYGLQADYSLRTDNWGNWRFYAIASYQPEHSSQLISALAPINDAGFSGGPLRWRGNFGIDWDAGPWTAGWNAQYF